LSSEKTAHKNDDEDCYCFLGEIYNYKQLKVNLENRGVLKPNRIQVILRLYEAYGIESFSMLDGMFAFSIHDKKQIKFSLLETFGEKPLYYCKK
jgi:asparagine synthase (glutamine-hydrolysing)